MYYSYPCPYCKKVFYTFSDSRDQAAQILDVGIMQYAKDYTEDHKSYELEQEPETETNYIYNKMAESKTYPTGGYELK